LASPAARQGLLLFTTYGRAQAVAERWARSFIEQEQRASLPSSFYKVAGPALSP
jgi:hypothetical protein